MSYYTREEMKWAKEKEGEIVRCGCIAKGRGGSEIIKEAMKNIMGARRVSRKLR